MIIVDTNVIVYLFVSSERTEEAERLLAADPDWAVPLLWRSEFRNALAGYLRRKAITPEQMRAFAATAESLVGAREYLPATDDVLSLVEQSTCSAYDCEFVALAKSLGVPLITEDSAVRNAFPSVAVSMTDYLR